MGSRKGSRATKSMEKKRITSFDQKQAEIQKKTENKKKIDGPGLNSGALKHFKFR